MPPTRRSRSPARAAAFVPSPAYRRSPRHGRVRPLSSRPAEPQSRQPDRGSESSFIAPDGLRIAYRRWVGSDGRVPVVLHHGFAANALINWVFPGVVAALSAAGRWVWAPDARGHGRSESPHDPDRYGEAVMTRDLIALFDEIGAAEVDLVGYSMGAIVALLVAAQGRRVRRLVIGGVGAGVVELGGVDTRVVSSDAIIAALGAPDAEAITDERARAFRQLADGLGADRQALAAQASRRHAQPIALERILAPTLVLAGDTDPLATRPEVLAAAIPHARLQLLSGDHMGAIGDPRLAALIVEHLA